MFPVRSELTILIDVATRSIAWAVLRPTTTAFDATLLIPKSMTPELMRPGWPEAASMAASAPPLSGHALSRPTGMNNAAARPVINPKHRLRPRPGVHIQTFRSACRSSGITLQPAPSVHPPTNPLSNERSDQSKPFLDKILEDIAGRRLNNEARMPISKPTSPCQSCESSLISGSSWAGRAANTKDFETPSTPNGY
ncbi:integrase catalytic subunit [Mycobacteroides abscessus subsp. bolletii]|nr:integrase catalytic subunit [Mycobacteroides abscessus subsp. bolletii]SLD85814.1 integrase catalytic subunit [Mycobacteroides abscessus subsp. bolletii]